jgi:hypothetical protein
MLNMSKYDLLKSNVLYSAVAALITFETLLIGLAGKPAAQF